MLVIFPTYWHAWFFRIRVTAYSRRPAFGFFCSRPRLLAARCTRIFARLAGLLDCLPCIVLPARDSPSQHVAHSFLMFEVGESCLRARLTWTSLLFIRSRVLVLYLLVARGSHFVWRRVSHSSILGLGLGYVESNAWQSLGLCMIDISISYSLTWP